MKMYWRLYASLYNDIKINGQNEKLMCSVVALSFSLPFSVAPFKPLREESYFPSSSLFIHAHHDFVKRTHNLNAVFQCAVSMSSEYVYFSQI